MPNAGKGVKQQNSHLLRVGMQNGTATLKESLGDSDKTKLTLTIQPSNCAPWFY